MDGGTSKLVTDVKLYIYETMADTTQAPSAADVVKSLNISLAEVESAFQSLSDQRLLVLEPVNPQQIRMAPPFSGAPTVHTVQVGGRSYYANCAWDAFGIAAALHKDAEIQSTCPDCNVSINLQVRNFRPENHNYIAHFAIPAALWWDDIIET